MVLRRVVLRFEHVRAPLRRHRRRRPEPGGLAIVLERKGVLDCSDHVLRTVFKVGLDF